MNTLEGLENPVPTIIDDVITGMETVPVRDTVVELNAGHGAVGVGREDAAVPVVVRIVPVPVPVPLGMVVELETGHGGTKTPDVDVAGSAD